MANNSVRNAMEMLDPRQRRYVLQATVGRMSRAAAANDAGFSNPPKSPVVVQAMAVMQDAIASELTIDLDFLQRGMYDAVQMARANGEAMTMIAGYREMGKLAGHYVEKKQIDVNVKHLTEEQLHELTDEELDGLIERAEAIELRKNEKGEFEVPGTS